MERLRTILGIETKDKDQYGNPKDKPGEEDQESRRYRLLYLTPPQGPVAEWRRRLEFHDTYKEYEKFDIVYERLGEPDVNVVSYELVFDPTNSEERDKAISNFTQSAIRAGWTEFLSPIVLPNVGFSQGEAPRPLTSITYFIGKVPYKTNDELLEELEAKNPL